jgi:hypothetical protein
MTLLSPILLLFAAFAAVPLVLHLYHRRKRIMVEFSTNRFFTDTVIQSQRRMQLQRLMLMLLRMAACVLLALAVSRPILEVLGMGGAQGRRDVVILLDDSLSMKAADAAVASGADRYTRLERAKAVAAGTLRQLARGDRAAVLTFSGKALGSAGLAGVELTSDPARLIGELASLTATDAGPGPFWAVEQAARIFDSPQQRARMLMVATDLQANQWPQSDWPQPREPIQTVLLHVEDPTTNNAMVESAVLSQGLAVIGQPNTLEIRLRNYRPGAIVGQLVVELDGKAQAHRPLELPGQSAHVEHVPLALEREASGPSTARAVAAQPATSSAPRQLKIAFVAPDALPEDNTLYATLETTRRLPILLVDGMPSDNPRRTPAFYLKAALEAVVADGEGLLVNSVGVGELPNESMDGYRVMILAGVESLSVEQVARLERFVLAGGGLEIFLAGGAAGEFHNGVLGSPRRPLGGLLPGKLKRLVASKDQAEPMHILEAQWDHAIFQRFTGPLRSALAGIDIRQAWLVEPREASVLARIDDRMPLMLERSYGRGRVLLVTTSPQPDWSSLPLRRSFVTLMSRTISYLAGAGSAARTNEVGQELVMLRGKAARPAAVKRPGSQPPRTAHLRAAGATGEAYLPAADVAAAGFYTVDAASPGEAAVVAAVNCPRSESAPETVDANDVARFSGRWRITPVSLARGEGGKALGGEGAIAKVLSAGKVSRGIWDMLLWVVLAALVIEPVVANRLGRKNESAALSGTKAKAA